MKLRRLLQVCSASVVICGGVLVSPVGAEVRGAILPGTELPPGPTAGEHLPLSTQLPTLTKAQQDLARMVVRSDARLLQILGPARSYTIARVGPWTTVKSPYLLGAVVEIELAEPLATTAAFPLLAYDQSETSSPPYSVNLRDLNIERATTLSLLVEFRTNTVLAIMPAGDAVATSVQPMIPANEGE